MKFQRFETAFGWLLALSLMGTLACGTRSRDTGAQAPAPNPPPALPAPPAQPPPVQPPPQPPQPPAPVPLAAQPPPAAAPREPDLVVPAHTRFMVALGRDVATDKDHAGDPWEGTLAEAVRVGARVAWPKGAPVQGVVTQSEPAGRLKGGKGGLGIRVTGVDGVAVETVPYRVAGDARARRNTEFIGGGAALGALVGVLAGRGPAAGHALGGAAVGAAAGTGVAAATASTVIRIPAGKVVGFTLSAPRKAVPRP